MAEEYEDEGSALEQEQAQLQEEMAMQQQMSAKKRVEEKLLKNKLKLIMSNLVVRTYLRPDEKQTIKKARKHENLKNDIKIIYTMLAINKAKLTMKTISSSPALYYVFIGALILLLIICVVAFIGSIMPWLFPEDEEGGTGGTVNSQFGIKGSDFYGARMIYKDDEKSAVAIIEDYVELVENGIEETKTITSASGTSVTLEVNIALPAEDYDYLTYDETTFKSEYPVLHTTVLDIAKIVYKADNSVDYSGLNLLECVNGILYFGYGQTVMADVSKIVTDAIVNNTTYEISGEGEIDKANDLDPQITQKLETLYSNTKYHTRTEKLFVKDYILAGDDKMMENISKENYVAFIFMPKKNVSFSKCSFSVGNADLSEFTINMANNGSAITLTKDNFDFGTEDTGNTFIYTTGENKNISVDTFTDIDTNNLNALSEGVSLFDIVENEDINYSTYLETKTETGVEYLTIKQNGLVVSLSNKEAFNFVEFETMWQAAY